VDADRTAGGSEENSTTIVKTIEQWAGVQVVQAPADVPGRLAR